MIGRVTDYVVSSSFLTSNTNVSLSIRYNLVRMKKIKIVDTVSQYQKIKKEVDIGISNVLRTGMYINGPEVKMFESELADYLGVKHCMSCANGTDALQVALMSLGLQKGDEVLIPTPLFL